MSGRLAWYAAALTTSAGLCFTPDMSVKTKGTRTMSPGLKLVVDGVILVIPYGREDRIIVGGQRNRSEL